MMFREQLLVRLISLGLYMNVREHSLNESTVCLSFRVPNRDFPTYDNVPPPGVVPTRVPVCPDKGPLVPRGPLWIVLKSFEETGKL